MTATNHAVTGALIATVVTNPVIGLPLALLSHFVLDAFPHFGAHTVAKPSSRNFRAILTFDALMMLAFLGCVVLAAARTDIASWWIVLAGGFLGALPDVMWFKHYQNDLKGEDKHWDIVRKAHKKIQQWEVSWGWTVEVIWFIACILILNRLFFS